MRAVTCLSAAAALFGAAEYALAPSAVAYSIALPALLLGIALALLSLIPSCPRSPDQSPPTTPDATFANAYAIPAIARRSSSEFEQTQAHFQRYWAAQIAAQQIDEANKHTP